MFISILFIYSRLNHIWIQLKCLRNQIEHYRAGKVNIDSVLLSFGQPWRAFCHLNAKPWNSVNYWNSVNSKKAGKLLKPKKKKIYPARGGEKGGNYQFRSGLFWWGRTSPVPPPTVLSSATGTCPATWDVAVFQLLSLSTLQLPLQLPRPKSLQGDMHVDIAVKIMLRAGIKWARSRLSRLRIGPLYLTGQISYSS